MHVSVAVLCKNLNNAIEKALVALNLITIDGVIDNQRSHMRDNASKCLKSI